MLVGLTGRRHLSQLGDKFKHMNEATPKKHIVICPISVEYKIILEAQKTFKHDGAVTQGRRVYFRNGLAEVDDETLEVMKQLPEWGTEFMLSNVTTQPARPLQVAPTSFGTEQEKENQKGQIETMAKKIDMLTEVMAQVVENMGKTSEKGDK